MFINSLVVVVVVVVVVCCIGCVPYETPAHVDTGSLAALYLFILEFYFFRLEINFIWQKIDFIMKIIFEKF